MSDGTLRRILVALVLALPLGASAAGLDLAEEVERRQAEKEGKVVTRVEPLGEIDASYLRRARRTAGELVRRRLGPDLDGSHRDLALLQRVLDEGHVRSSDVATQQALGVALGDVMARELGYRWVVLIDERGRSRALQRRGVEKLVFPVTMFSKRIGLGDRVRVHELFALAESLAAEAER